MVNRYDLRPEKVYTKEQQKAMKTSKNFYIKTTNSMNITREKLKKGIKRLEMLNILS